jgi:hypothetical protein
LTLTRIVSAVAARAGAAIHTNTLSATKDKRVVDRARTGEKGRRLTVLLLSGAEDGQGAMSGSFALPWSEVKTLKRRSVPWSQNITEFHSGAALDKPTGGRG